MPSARMRLTRSTSFHTTLFYGNEEEGEVVGESQEGVLSTQHCSTETVGEFSELDYQHSLKTPI